jgi:A/G-specific adenine glycosylase
VTLRANGSAAAESVLDGASPRAAFRKALVKWFDASARDLPWRRTRDAYAIWLSEIMLQQTQVATVVGYYERFLTRFPTISDLAAGAEQEVLKLWEGLGYYRRARQLHSAAQQVVAIHMGHFPREFDAIRALPGVGRYTAGAIASFAYDDRKPIVEANTLRLYSRLLGVRSDPRGKQTQEKLWQFAEQILPPREPGKLNQALIELGSQICKPRQPLCGECPVRRWCSARIAGIVESIPALGKKTQYEDALEAAVVIYDRRRRILLRQRGDKERWAGMWDFPRGALATGPAAREPSSLNLTKVREFVSKQTGAEIELLSEQFRIRHGVTRFRIELVCFDAKLTRPLQRRADLRWVTRTELAEVALSVSARKIALSLSRPEKQKKLALR